MQGTHKGLPAEGSGNGTCLHKSKLPGSEAGGMEPSWSTHSAWGGGCWAVGGLLLLTGYRNPEA